MVANIEVASSVRIKNARLRAVFLVMQTVVCGLIAWLFVSTKGGTITLPNSPMVSFDLTDGSVARGFAYNSSQDRVCSLPRGWLRRTRSNHPIRHLFEKFACAYVSAIGCPSDDQACVDLFETGSYDSPFNAQIYLKDQYIHVGHNVNFSSAGPSMLRADESALVSFFNVFTQAYVLNFTYQYTVHKSPSKLFGFNDRLPMFGTNNNSTTVLLNAAGSPLQTFQPGEDVLVSVPKLLQIARGHRTEVNDEAIQAQVKHHISNYPGSDTMFPSWVWDSGATIHLVINCYADQYDLHQEFDIDGPSNAAWDFDASFESPVCVLQAHLVKAEALDFGVTTKEHGRTVRTIRTALRVVSKTGTSYFRATEPNALFYFFTSALVILAQPQKVIRFVALTCLGHLSRIYRKVIVKECEISLSCARAVLQMASYSVCFHKLADTVCADGAPGSGLSQRKLVERVQDIVSHRQDDLDPTEVRALAEFAFRMALKEEYRSQQRSSESNVLARLRRYMQWTIAGHGEDPRPGDDDVMDIDGFCQATGNEALGLDVLTKLFDSDRRVPLGEQLFTPTELWHQVHGPRGGSSQHHDPSPAWKAGLRRSNSSIVTSFENLWGKTSATEPVEPTPPVSANLSQLAQVSDRRSDWGQRVAGTRSATAIWSGGGTVSFVDPEAMRLQSLSAELQSLDAKHTSLCQRIDTLQTELQYDRDVRMTQQQAFHEELACMLRDAAETSAYNRAAQERLFRDELSHTLQVAAEQAAFKADLAVYSRINNKGQQPPPVVMQQTSGVSQQDLAKLRNELYLMINRAELRFAEIARDATKKTPELVQEAGSVVINAAESDEGGLTQQRPRSTSQLNVPSMQAAKIIELEGLVLELGQRIDAVESKSLQCLSARSSAQRFGAFLLSQNGMCR